MTQKLFLSLFSIFLFLNGYAKNREIMPLDKEWLFQKKDITEPIQIYTSWDTVNIPHDWAINGPFDLNQDMQFVQVIEDGDKKQNSAPEEREHYPPPEWDNIGKNYFYL